MKKDINVNFLCMDCYWFNSCEYYHNRKKDGSICKYFKLLPQNKQNIKRKDNKNMDKTTAIKILKNVRRELIDYRGINNPIAVALYIVIESAEDNTNDKKGGSDNE